MFAVTVKDDFMEFGVWIFHMLISANAHTMVGDNHCSKTDHSLDNLQYHKPSSAA